MSDAATSDLSTHTHPALAGFHPLKALMDWFSRRRDNALDSEEARRIAEDLGITVEDLVRLSAESDTEATLMTQMMSLHGLDRAKLEQKYGAAVRDMAVTCGRCTNKGECSHDLATGDALHNFDDYCANSEVIRDFVKTEAE